MEYDGGEVVQLKQDHSEYGLTAGDCGVVWGVYNIQPITYEATFCPQQGQNVDMMFEADEVELVTDTEQLPMADHLRAIQQTFEVAEKRLRQATNQAP